MNPRNLIKLFVVIVGLVLFCSASFNDVNQDRLEIPALGFSMINPPGWLSQAKQSFHENLTKFELKRAEIETLISDYQNSLPISTVTKYHPMNANGVLPTINVIGRNNPVRDGELFLESMGISIPMLKKVTYDFTLTEQPQYKIISGVRAGYFCAEYSLKLADGSKERCRNQTYAIPNGDFVIQISMIDKPTDQCDEEFQQFLDEINVSIMD